MVDSIRRREDNVVVAVLADICGLDVGRVFTDRLATVMATETVVHNVCVIECCRYPPDRCMTIVAIISTGDMRRRFPRRNRAVVAGRAGTHDLGMVDNIGRCEENVVVAVLTDFRCLDMRGILADCIGPVVAAEAISRDVDVIKIRRNPRVRRMAVITIVAAGDMRRVLPGGNCAIVTG